MKSAPPVGITLKSRVLRGIADSLLVLVLPLVIKRSLIECVGFGKLMQVTCFVNCYVPVQETRLLQAMR